MRGPRRAQLDLADECAYGSDAARRTSRRPRPRRGRRSTRAPRSHRESRRTTAREHLVELERRRDRRDDPCQHVLAVQLGAAPRAASLGRPGGQRESRSASRAFPPCLRARDRRLTTSQHSSGGKRAIEDDDVWRDQRHRAGGTGPPGARPSFAAAFAKLVITSVPRAHRRSGAGARGPLDPTPVREARRRVEAPGSSGARGPRRRGRVRACDRRGPRTRSSSWRAIAGRT